jgi:hypothetical protein
MKTATRFSSALIATAALAGTASAKVLDLPITVKEGYVRFTTLSITLDRE